MKTVTAVLTSFNRAQFTASCIERLLNSPLPEGWMINIVLVDDGSRDGTCELISERFPNVHVLRGNGSLYWNGGMRLGMQYAEGMGSDVFLWVNDDLELDPGSVGLAVDCVSREAIDQDKGVIVVGNVYSRRAGKQSYGAVEFPYFFRRTTPRFLFVEEGLGRAESMNGNFVAISNGAYKVVGELDPVFVHTMSDFDYGLRANALGVPVLVLPGYVGYCDRNDQKNNYRDGRSSLLTRWRSVIGPKGKPFKAWWIYTRRHTGLMFPLLFILPYVRVIFLSLLPRLSGEPQLDRRNVRGDEA